MIVFAGTVGSVNREGRACCSDKLVIDVDALRALLVEIVVELKVGTGSEFKLASARKRTDRLVKAVELNDAARCDVEILRLTEGAVGLNRNDAVPENVGSAGVVVDGAGRAEVERTVKFQIARTGNFRRKRAAGFLLGVNKEPLVELFTQKLDLLEAILKVNLAAVVLECAVVARHVRDKFEAFRIGIRILKQLFGRTRETLFKHEILDAVQFFDARENIEVENAARKQFGTVCDRTVARLGHIVVRLRGDVDRRLVNDIERTLFAHEIDLTELGVDFAEINRAAVER